MIQKIQCFKAVMCNREIIILSKYIKIYDIIMASIDNVVIRFYFLCLLHLVQLDDY